AMQRARLQERFHAEVFPVCTPLAGDPAHPFPFLSNRSLNLGVVLWDARGRRSLRRINVPSLLPRRLRARDGGADREVELIWLEDLLANTLDAFFTGVEVQDVSLFRLVRDADLELKELEATDMRETVQAGVRRQRFGETVCVQLESEMPEEV